MALETKISTKEMKTYKIIKYTKHESITPFYDYIAYPDWFILKLNPIFEEHRTENKGFIFILLILYKSLSIWSNVFCCSINADKNSDSEMNIRADSDPASLCILA